MGETNFQPREFPQIKLKAKDEKRKKKERLKVGNNNGQLHIANATSGGARKAACAKKVSISNLKNARMRGVEAGEYDFKAAASQQCGSEAFCMLG